MNTTKMLTADLAYAKLPKSRLETWEGRSYDVWGNARDGFDVNDTYRIGEVTIRAKLRRYNVGTLSEFASYEVSTRQLKRAFSIRGGSDNGQGDGTTVYFDAANGRPLGECMRTAPGDNERQSFYKYPRNLVGFDVSQRAEKRGHKPLADRIWALRRAADSALQVG